MKMKIFIYILSITILFVGCSKDVNNTNEKPKAPLVKVEELKSVSISKSVMLTGTVEAKVVANVVAPADGYIEKLNAVENQFVRKEKVLAMISSQERTSLVSQTKNKKMWNYVHSLSRQKKNWNTQKNCFSVCR